MKCIAHHCFRTSSSGGAVYALRDDTRSDHSCVDAAVDAVGGGGAVAASFPYCDVADRPLVMSPVTRGQCGPEK